MKKPMIIVAMCLMLSVAQSQNSNEYKGILDTNTGTGIGISFFNEGSIGLYVDFFISNIYFNISSNFNKGNGDYLVFHSSHTRLSEKLAITTWNIGYIVQTSRNTMIIPIIGMGTIFNIYNDTLGWNTWYRKRKETKVNIGLRGTLKISDYFSISCGIGTVDQFNFGFITNI